MTTWGACEKVGPFIHTESMEVLPQMLIETDALYTEKESAGILRVSASFLAKKRVTGDGPRYVKIGRAVRYTGTSLIDYKKARTRNSTSQR